MTAVWSHGVYTCVLLFVKMNVVPSGFWKLLPRMNHPAIIHCLPGGMATDVKANLKMVLAKANAGECREYRDIVIHVGTNDVRMKQSDVTKRNIASACKSARKVCRHLWPRPS